MDEIKEISIYNKEDIIASTVKSYLGILPYIGTALGEVVSFLIPNQRMDRITKYLLKLNSEMNELTDEIMRDKEKINLIETGLKSSVNSAFEEKCEWIANIVVNGLKDNIEITMADNIINIVSQLNYEQIIILYYYVFYKNKGITEETKTFKKKFNNIFNYEIFINDDIDMFNILKSKEKFNLITHANFGLLENRTQIYKLSRIDMLNITGNSEIEKLKSQLIDLNNSIVDKFNIDKYSMTVLGKEVIKAMNLEM